jgi:predicted transcriptional regulator
MRSRRSKLEIFLDVLRVIKNGTSKPTRIMYGSNLSWKLLQETIESLINQGLIEEIDTSSSRDKRTNIIYKITGKGESVLRYYHHASGLIRIDEISDNDIKLSSW